MKEMTKAEQIKYFTDVLRRCNRKKEGFLKPALVMWAKKKLAEFKETA